MAEAEREYEEQLVRRLITTDYEKVLETLKKAVTLRNMMEDPEQRLKLEIDECIRIARNVARILCYYSVEPIMIPENQRLLERWIKRCTEILTAKLTVKCEAVSIMLEERRKHIKELLSPKL
jgi:hypothetical protein